MNLLAMATTLVEPLTGYFPVVFFGSPSCFLVERPKTAICFTTLDNILFPAFFLNWRHTCNQS